MLGHPVPDHLIQRARTLAHSGGRRLLGIVGPPGAGKSTLAEGLVRELAPLACHVPMDGFHLANAELGRLDLRDRKGAPETFDAGGYVALLERMATSDEDIVYAPQFLREIEEPVAGAIPVPRSVPLVVTEGNYLLLEQGPWCRVRTLLDEVWFVEAEDEARLNLLIERHVRFGKEPEAARAWALGTDERNADVVATSRHRADLVVTLDLEAPAQILGQTAGSRLVRSHSGPRFTSVETVARRESRGHMEQDAEAKRRATDLDAGP